MKIIKVLVDELPKSCAECDYLAYNRLMVNQFKCAFTSIAVDVREAKRLPVCPFALEHDNAKIANEVM